MCEVTTSTDLEDRAKRIKQRIEDLRIDSPKLYGKLNPILSDLVLFLDSAAGHVLRQCQQIEKMKREASESNERSQLCVNQPFGGRGMNAS